jgi:hypothetical protein
VRDRIGSVLTNIFLSDLEYPANRKNNEKSNKRNPNIADFMNEIVPQLELLKQEPDPAVVTFRKKQQPNGATQGIPSGGVPPSDMMVPPPGAMMGMMPQPGGAMPRMPPPEMLQRMGVTPEMLQRMPSPQVRLYTYFSNGNRSPLDLLD